MFSSIVRDEGGWETVRRDEKYLDPYTHLVVEHVRSPARTEPRTWTVVHRKAAAVVAPMTPDGSFVLVRQERIPIRAAIWEFPAGQIDEQTEPHPELIRETARRELREETGYTLAEDGELIELGVFFTSAGFTDEHGYLFLARGVVPHPDGAEHDPGEAILDCRAFPPGEFRRMIAEGEIRDANTLATYARLCAMGLV